MGACRTTIEMCSPRSCGSHGGLLTPVRPQGPLRRSRTGPGWLGRLEGCSEALASVHPFNHLRTRIFSALCRLS